MVDMLRTAVSGLRAFQAAMATTGHNVANVNTRYYSRQRVELGTSTPEKYPYGYMGSGVDIQSVTRSIDEFVMKQMRGHTSGVSQYENLNGLTNQLSALLGDTDVGLTPDLEAFFGSLQDLADSPASITARQVFLDEGQTLTTRIQDIDSALNSLRDSVDTGIRNAVTTINDLTTGIAKVNRDIAQASDSATNPPNDLFDNRDRMLADLSEMVGIQVVTQDDGSLNVFMGSGQPLIVGVNAYQLEAVQSGFDPQEITVRLEGQAEGSDLERYITSGELGGYFEFRKTILNPAQDGLGLLVMGLAETFNEQHQRGMDLDGNLGGNLFNVGSPKVLSHSTNEGSAVFSAMLNDTMGPYELSYDGTDYTLTRLSDNEIVADNFSLDSLFSADGVTIGISSGSMVNPGDKFLLQPDSRGELSVNYNGNGLTTDIQFNAKAITTTDSSQLVRSDYEILTSGVASRTSETNAGVATISAPTVTDEDNENLTNTVKIEFTGVGVYKLTDQTTGDTLTGAYTSGGNISYNGWTAQISGALTVGDTFEISAGYTVNRLSDNKELLSKSDLMSLNDVMRSEGLHLTLTDVSPNSPPKDGDRFLIQPTRNGAPNFSLNITDPRKVAAAALITTSATTTNLGSGVISSGKVIDSSRTTLPNNVEIRFTSNSTFNVIDFNVAGIAVTDSGNTGTGTIITPIVTDYENQNLGNTVQIEFTTANLYNVVDITTNTTLVMNVAYTAPGGSIIPSSGNYNGWTTNISGVPQAGDKFQIQPGKVLDKGVTYSSGDSISYNGWEINITGNPYGNTVSSANPSNWRTAVIATPIVLDKDNDNLANTVEIQFIDPTHYNVVDTITSTTLANNILYTPPGGSAIPSSGDYNGWSVKISGSPQAGDNFQISGSPPSATADSSNAKTAAITTPTVTDYQADNLTHTVEIRFTSATTYDLVDMTNDGATISAGNSYTSPGPGTIAPAGYGWSVDISGSPQTGDKFQIKNDGDTFQIKSNQSGIGDNRNALELVRLETTKQLMGGNDYRGVYAQMIAEVGAQGRRIENTLQSQQALLEQSVLSRESISGVNLDEEAANLVRFQQAYQAAAQIIQTSNSLFSSLLEAVRS